MQAIAQCQAGMLLKHGLRLTRLNSLQALQAHRAGYLLQCGKPKQQQKAQIQIQAVYQILQKQFDLKMQKQVLIQVAYWPGIETQ